MNLTDLIIELSKMGIDYVLLHIAFDDDLDKLMFLNSFHEQRGINLLYSDFGIEREKVIPFIKHKSKKCLKYIFDMCANKELLMHGLTVATAMANDYQLFRKLFIECKAISADDLFDEILFLLGTEYEINDYKILCLAFGELGNQCLVMVEPLMAYAIKHQREDLIIKLAGFGLNDIQIISTIRLMCSIKKYDEKRFLAPFPSITKKFPQKMICEYSANEETCELADILVDIHQKYWQYDKSANDKKAIGKNLMMFMFCDITIITEE